MKEKVNNVLDWERDRHKIFVSEKQDYGKRKERKRWWKAEKDTFLFDSVEKLY